ncbi:MAG: corrinoid protein [Deltaproteobacteria bacterium]|nr:corrinoid protein [Deltaproteobacteria bacterium]
MSDIVNRIKNAVIERRRDQIQELVSEAIADKVDLEKVINDGLIAAMDVVGSRFGTGEIFVPEMLVSALTMKLGLAIVKPRLIAERGNISRGTIVMGTVKGDLHDIGKNIVIMMLEGAGFDVVDLGVDLPVETILAEIEKIAPKILGLSALLTTTMPELRNVIDALESRGLRRKVKVMVGGAPVDARFAKMIGADGYGKDAAQAVELARSLVS